MDDPSAYEWKNPDWTPRPFPDNIIYELHVGSFTPEGTFTAAAEKLPKLAELGFTAIQLMPICEHSDSWGYNPRQHFSLHAEFGEPDDLRAMVRQLRVRIRVELFLQFRVVRTTLSVCLGSPRTSKFRKFWNQGGVSGLESTKWFRGVLGSVRVKLEFYVEGFLGFGLALLDTEGFSDWLMTSALWCKG